MISWYLTAELQGYYYTFTSLIALQVFLELGFSIVVTQFASHEWANLNLDKNGYIVLEEKEFLAASGSDRFSDLIEIIPSKYILDGDLGIGDPLSEIDIERELQQ